MDPSGANALPSIVGSLTEWVRSGGAPGRASTTCSWAELEPMSKTPSSISARYPQPYGPCLPGAPAMKEHGIGTVLVLADGELTGLVTDRDITVRVLAENRDPLTTRVGDICSTELAVLGPDDDVDQATSLVRDRAVRCPSDALPGGTAPDTVPRG